MWEPSNAEVQALTADDLWYMYYSAKVNYIHAVSKSDQAIWHKRHGLYWDEIKRRQKHDKDQ